MKQLLAVSFLAFATILNSFSAPPPTSAEQLRSEFEAALRAKETNAIVSLIYWKDVSEKGKSIDAQETVDMVTHDIVSVELSSWPTNDWATNNLFLETDIKGIHYKPNLQAIGRLNVKFSNIPGFGAQMPYGKIGDTFLMAATIEEKSATVSTNQIKN
jgi:hypothetical protein